MTHVDGSRLLGNKQRDGGLLRPGPAPAAAAPHVSVPDGLVVQLRYAPLPSLLRRIAVHYWFNVWDLEAGRWRRWEIWQRREAGGTAWGHLHRDLLHPDREVGGGPICHAAEWSGAEAEALASVLCRPEEYPFRDLYRYWPGPNSNTYVAWALRRAGIAVDLDPRAVGKDYLGLAGAARCVTGRGFQVETPLLGARLGSVEGVELHLFGLTFGVGVRPAALKTPLGRLPLAREERETRGR